MTETSDISSSMINLTINNNEEEETREMLSKIDPKTAPTAPCQGQIKYVQLLKVKDGDTLEVLMKLSSDSCLKFAVRVYGIDTPEKTLRSGTSEKEKKAGLLVKKYVTDFYKDQSYIYIKVIDYEKWGGRYLAEVYTNSERKHTLSHHLVHKKFAKEYHGDKKEKWTDKELDYIISKLEN